MEEGKWESQISSGWASLAVVAAVVAAAVAAAVAVVVVAAAVRVAATKDYRDR